MFRSRDVAYLKHSSLSSRSCIFGMGKGFLLLRLFSSLKSEIKRAVPFFLGIMNVGAAHSELSIRFNITISYKRYTSYFSVPSCTRGIGKGFA